MSHGTLIIPKSGVATDCCCDKIISHPAPTFFLHVGTWSFKLRAMFKSVLMSSVSALPFLEELKMVFYYFLCSWRTS